MDRARGRGARRRGRCAGARSSHGARGLRRGLCRGARALTADRTPLARAGGTRGARHRSARATDRVREQRPSRRDARLGRASVPRPIRRSPRRVRRRLCHQRRRLPKRVRPGRRRPGDHSDRRPTRRAPGPRRSTQPGSRRATRRGDRRRRRTPCSVGRHPVVETIRRVLCRSAARLRRLEPGRPAVESCRGWASLRRGPRGVRARALRRAAVALRRRSRVRRRVASLEGGALRPQRSAGRPLRRSAARRIPVRRPGSGSRRAPFGRARQARHVHRHGGRPGTDIRGGDGVDRERLPRASARGPDPCGSAIPASRGGAAAPAAARTPSSVLGSRADLSHDADQGVMRGVQSVGQ